MVPPPVEFAMPSCNKQAPSASCSPPSLVSLDLGCLFRAGSTDLTITGLQSARLMVLGPASCEQTDHVSINAREALLPKRACALVCLVMSRGLRRLTKTPFYAPTMPGPYCRTGPAANWAGPGFWDVSARGSSPKVRPVSSTIFLLIWLAPPTPSPVE